MHYSHGMSYSRLEQIVGLFFLLPLIVVGGTFWILARSQHLFEETYPLRASFREGQEIALATPVVVSGVVVGQVAATGLTEDNKVEVQMKILRRYARTIHADAAASIGRTGMIVGEQRVILKPGRADLPPAADNALIASEEPRELEEIMGQARAVLEKVTRTVDMVERAAQSLPPIMDSTRNTMAHFDTASARLPAVLESVQRTTRHVETTAERFTGLPDRLQTSIDQLPPLLQSVQRSLDNVESVTQEVRSSARLLPGIMQATGGTIDDVNVVVQGAKRSWPIRNFVRSEAVPEGSRGLRDGIDR